MNTYYWKKNRNENLSIIDWPYENFKFIHCMNFLIKPRLIDVYYYYLSMIRFNDKMRQKILF